MPRPSGTANFRCLALPARPPHGTQALKELGLTADQFIDLCILCGCDYAPKISGIGPGRALQLITKHGSMEKVGGHARGSPSPAQLAILSRL